VSSAHATGNYTFPLFALFAIIPLFLRIRQRFLAAPPFLPEQAAFSHYLKMQLLIGAAFVSPG
jgi:hypothetical protein